MSPSQYYKRNVTVRSKVLWGLWIGFLGTLATGLVSANGVTTTLLAVKAPEIDPASAASALTLLFGGLAVLRGRKRAKV
jgi:hypothetical protein